MNNLQKVTAPDDVTSASHGGESFTRAEDGFFYMPMDAAYALRELGFQVVTEPVAKSENDDQGNGAPAPATGEGQPQEGEGAPASTAAEGAPTGTQSDASATAGDELDSLLGVEGQPDGYALEGGDILPAREVLKSAFTRTGATIDEWNALSDTDRASFVQSVVDELPLAKVVDPAATDTLVNEGGKPAPETSEGNEGGDGVSDSPAASA